MAVKLKENLEPENGDFIAFLKDIERGNAHVKGLTVTLPEDKQGMVVVRKKADVIAEKSHSMLPAWASQAEGVPDYLAYGGMFAGAVLAPVGAIMMGLGMYDPHSFEYLIPPGMILLFAGTVMGMHNKKKVSKPKQNENQTQGS